MILFVGTIGFIGISLAVWGTQTRGTWSQNIGIVGGILRMIGIIVMFLQIGISKGFLYLLATFIAGAIMQKIFPKYI